MQPRVSEAARIFLVASFLVLVAQGPTFSGRGSQTALTVVGGGVCTTCTDTNKQADKQVSQGKADPSVKETGECTKEKKAQMTPEELQKKCPASKEGTTTFTDENGKQVQVSSGGSDGPVSQGSGGGGSPSAASQYAAADGKPAISQVPLTPPDAYTSKAIEDAFPGVSENAAKLAYPINPPASTGSGMNDIVNGPASSIPGTELDYSRPPSVSLNDDVRSNAVALNASQGSVPLMESARSYLPVSSGASGFDGQQGFAYDFSNTGAAQYGGLYGADGAPVFDFSNTGAAQYAGTFSPQDVFGNSGGVAAQPADTSRPGLNVYYGPDEGFVETLNPDTQLTTKDGKTVTAGYLVDNGVSDVRLSDLQKSFDLSADSPVTRQTFDGNGKLLTANSYDNLDSMFSNLDASSKELADSATTRVTPTPDTSYGSSMDSTPQEPLEVSVISSKQFEELQAAARAQNPGASESPSLAPSATQLAFAPSSEAAALLGVRGLGAPAQTIEPVSASRVENVEYASPTEIAAALPAEVSASDAPEESVSSGALMETADASPSPGSGGRGGGEINSPMPSREASAPGRESSSVPLGSGEIPENVLATDIPDPFQVSIGNGGGGSGGQKPDSTVSSHNTPSFMSSALETLGGVLSAFNPLASTPAQAEPATGSNQTPKELFDATLADMKDIGAQAVKAKADGDWSMGIAVAKAGEETSGLMANALEKIAADPAATPSQKAELQKLATSIRGESAAIPGKVEWLQLDAAAQLSQKLRADIVSAQALVHQVEGQKTASAPALSASVQKEAAKASVPPPIPATPAPAPDAATRSSTAKPVTTHSAPPVKPGADQEYTGEYWTSAELAAHTGVVYKTTASTFNDKNCANGPCPSTPGVAHPTAPIGTIIKVCNGARCENLPVVDRGPSIKGRSIDVNPAAQKLLGMASIDLQPVTFQFVGDGPAVAQGDISSKASFRIQIPAKAGAILPIAQALARSVSLCIGSSDCGSASATQVTDKAYINSLCQPDRGCAAKSLGAQPDPKFPERAITDEHERAQEYAREVAAAGAASKGNQPVLVDNCQYSGACTEILKAMSDWNAAHPDKTLVPMINNPLLVGEKLGKMAAQALGKMASDMKGGIVMEPGSGTIEQHDAFRKAVGNAMLPILAVGTGPQMQALAQEIASKALQNIGTSISSATEGAAGYRDAIAGLPVAVGAPTTVERALSRFAENLAASGVQAGDPQEVATQLTAQAKDVVHRAFQSDFLNSSEKLVEIRGSGSLEVRPEGAVYRVDSAGQETQVGSIRHVSGAAPTEPAPVRITGTRIGGINPAIARSMEEASRLLPAGYTAKVISASRNPGESHVGSRSLHIQRDAQGNSLAVDVQITDPNGNVLKNIRAPQNFGIYRDFMQNVKAYQDKMFPQLASRGRWGGYFVSGDSQDLMHYDLGPKDVTAAGNWEQGLNRMYAYYGMPGDVGVGMGSISTYKIPDPASIVPAEFDEFTSTDGSVRVTLPTNINEGTVKVTPQKDENGDTTYALEYTPPVPPLPPADDSPMARAMAAARGAMASAQQKMQDMFKQIQSMFGGGGGGSKGGGSGGGSGSKSGGTGQQQPIPLPPTTEPVGAVRLSCTPDTVVNDSSATPLTISWQCPTGTRSTGTGFSTLGAQTGNVRLTVSTSSAIILYKLECAGTKTESTTCSVKVKHPRVVLVAKPADVAAGKSVDFEWNSTDVDSCKLYAPPAVLVAAGSGTGRATSLPLSRSVAFKIVCTTGAATTSASATVHVEGDSQPPLETQLP